MANLKYFLLALIASQLIISANCGIIGDLTFFSVTIKIRNPLFDVCVMKVCQLNLTGTFIFLSPAQQRERWDKKKHFWHNESDTENNMKLSNRRHEDDKSREIDDYCVWMMKISAQHFFSVKIQPRKLEIIGSFVAAVDAALLLVTWINFTTFFSID